MQLVVFLLLLVVACGSGASGVRPDDASTPVVVATSPAWTRAEWLTAAGGFAANPATMPSLADPQSRPLFEKLVSTKAWLELDRADFQRDAEELLSFFPALRKLMVVLMSKGAATDLAALVIYELDVHRAITRAALGFLDDLPADDPTLPVRRAGLDKVRLAAAIEVCGLLYLAMSADEVQRTRALAKLTMPQTYELHSAEGLQLVLATLDERLFPQLAPVLGASYRRVREVVARAHDKAQAPSLTRTIYQGMGPPSQDQTKLASVVSTSGRFSVELSPAALAKRIETKLDDGSTVVQHWIELQDGDARFEAACLDGAAESVLAESIENMPGVTRRPSPHPGRWFTVTNDEREGWMRLLAIPNRSCIISVEAPSGLVPEARAEAFLLSFKAVP